MTIKQGDKVKIEYEGKLDDGTLFDSTNKTGQQTPLEFEIGAGKILPEFEKNVLGMKKGGKKEIKLPPEKAYGPVNPQAKQEIPKTAFQGQEPKKGMMIGLNTPTGQQIPAKIDEVKDSTVVIDMNHPLAGKNLNFKIKVVDVEEKK